MTARSTALIPFGHCPHCKKPLTAEVALDFTPPKELEPNADGEIMLTGRTVGMRLSHDCIPSVTR